MLELIKYIVDQFAEDKENVSYEVTEKDRAIEVTVSLSPADMGKVIGQQEMTLEEIGDKFGLTRERVRQIKEKAIRRLRQSNRSKLLKSYLG